MEKLIIKNFWEMHPGLHQRIETSSFINADDSIKKEAHLTRELREKSGLDKLVQGLEFIVINTEDQKLLPAVEEILIYTGYDLKESFENEEQKVVVLCCENSPDLLITVRKNGENPFYPLNLNPKSEHLPNTRIEAFFYRTPELSKYHSIQLNRGVIFTSNSIVNKENYEILQTIPSCFTGISYGVVNWKGERIYKTSKDTDMAIDVKKPDFPYIKNIKNIDHAATRLPAKNRDAAIIEFMELTNYNFEFAIYVENLNSITNVARLSAKDFAMVFTSGISSENNEENLGPTEKFVRNYGARVHHLAFITENIEETFQNLKEKGQRFLIDLVGSEEEGLKQTFTYPSPNTLIVNEYILRYGDFDGFFTKSNVTNLTLATDKQ